MAHRESDNCVVCAWQRVIGWVKVPLSLGLGGSYPNLGVTPQGPIAIDVSEGRASTVRWSPEGLRRSTRL
ncbi:hypothetical protein GCM10025859_25610 [Alicyclobacillus fastidiosus]|nr:hypothetical protein GCM10025859_25610 [Alicyclobacillus fastidiosus]